MLSIKLGHFVRELNQKFPLMTIKYQQTENESLVEIQEMQSLIAISQTLKCRIRKQKQIRTYNMHFNKNVKILSLKHAEKRFFFRKK